MSCGYTQGKPVLQDISLCIEQDDRVALVGPNGEGKSTLVKTLLGELATLAGSVSKHRWARGTQSALWAERGGLEGVGSGVEWS